MSKLLHNAFCCAYQHLADCSSFVLHPTLIRGCYVHCGWSEEPAVGSMLSTYFADAVTWENGLTYQQLRRALILMRFMLHSGQQLYITAGLWAAFTLHLQLYVG